jgi:Rad3-related DNA helicase
MFCVDPSYQLQQRIEKANSVVFFSATLLPLRYYIKLLCTNENPFAIYVDSIFPKKNRKIMIGRDVTSKYKNRNKDQYKNIASYIYEVTKQKNGNYMIFAPSYSFMENVIEAYRNYFLQDETIIEQKSYMTETQREEFLEAFQSDHETTLLGFCVLGGIFSEGIDLTGECLIGSIVIGTGLPQISNERKIISDYFDAIDGNGFYYSYLYPGMNKVMQAAGRVIRTMEDKGVVGLLDERFLHSEYKNTFPKEWDDCTFVTKETVGKCVFDFWKNSEK